MNSMDAELRIEIRKIALQNAFDHGGQTQDKVILGKILGIKPEFRTKVKEITEGKGLSVVYDGVGKNTFNGSIECLKLRGTLVSFG
ncbi:MAG: zinc-binding dehydrogenase, partial [Nitrosopumilus sp.]